MNNPIVEEIRLCKDNGDTVFRLGSRGITNIIPKYKNGEMNSLIYYEILKEGKLYAELHEWSVLFYVEVKP